MWLSSKYGNRQPYRCFLAVLVGKLFDVSAVMQACYLRVERLTVTTLSMPTTRQEISGQWQNGSGNGKSITRAASWQTRFTETGTILLIAM